MPLVDERHRVIAVDDVARVLLLRLDGRTERRDLLGALTCEVREGRMSIAVDGEELDTARQAAALENLLDYHLGTMAEHGLLFE